MGMTHFKTNFYCGNRYSLGVTVVRVTAALDSQKEYLIALWDSLFCFKVCPNRTASLPIVAVTDYRSKLPIYTNVMCMYQDTIISSKIAIKLAMVNASLRK